jgi:hypothetical protein
MAVPVGDDGGLAEAIRTVVRPETGRALGLMAHRLVGSEYRAMQTVERLMWMYRNPSMAQMAG